MSSHIIHYLHHRSFPFFTQTTQSLHHCPQSTRAAYPCTAVYYEKLLAIRHPNTVLDEPTKQSLAKLT